MGHWMQRLVCIWMSAEEYARVDPHQVVAAPLECRGCGRAGRLHRHGIYVRCLWDGREVLRISIARFVCPGCGRTTSCLPDFALPYRLVAIGKVDIFFRAEPEVRRAFGFADLLRRYARRWQAWWSGLCQHIGCYFGRLRVRDPCGGWKELAGRAGGIAAASRVLVETFGASLFGQYRIHARPAFAR